MLTRSNIVFALLLFVGSLLCCETTQAQAVPDTSLNQVLSKRVQGEADTIRMYADTVTVKVRPPLPWEPKPKRAGLFAAIVPGMGQLYNKQYWKMPIVYAALGTTVYFIQDNLKQYKRFRKAYIGRIDNDPSTTDKGTDTENLDNNSLLQLQNDYRRQADVSILLTALGYTLQIMDAVASAHLKNFDISRDISLRTSPFIFDRGVGIALVMNFK